MIKLLTFFRYREGLFLCCLFAIFFSAQSNAQAPTVTSFSPSVITMRTMVTITGTNFTGTTSVSFGGTNATSFNVISATQIVATVGAGASGAVKVTTGSGSATGGNVTYVAAAGTPASAAVTRVITDFNGFWSSTATSAVAANQPDTRHNMMAFTYGGTLYSTGVNDLGLTLNLLGFNASDFRALPINTITGNTFGTANYLAFGTKVDGNANATNYLSPAISTQKVKDVLTDGTKGLDLGTGVTNISSSMVLEFSVSNVVAAAINDSKPDIVVTQIASPTTVVDVYAFTDVNGNIIGNPVQANLDAVDAIGTSKLDLFTLPTNTAYADALPVGNGTPGTRDMRMIAFKLSDFGITTANSASIAKFKLMPGGDSDPAFIAYNAAAFLIPSPLITSQPGSYIACIGSPSLATFSVTAVGSGLTYQWRRNGVNIPGATGSSYMAGGVITAADVGAYTVVVSNVSGSVISEPGYLNAMVISQPTPVTVCQNGSALLGTAAGGYNVSYRWYFNVANNNTTGTLIAGETSANYAPPTNVAGTVYYYAQAIANGYACSAVPTQAVAVTVNPTTVAGTASTSKSICTGTTTSLTLAGNTGTIQWQQSANGTSGWASVSGGSGATTTTYTTATLSATTYFRALVTSGECSSAASNVITITVTPLSNAGTVSANQSICFNNTTTISTSGSAGSIQWQQSANGTSGWVSAIGGSGANTASYTTASLTATTYYRALVVSGECSAVPSGVITVAVSPVSNAGTVSANQTICANTNTTITTSSSVGAIQWQQSANGTSGWVSVVGGSGATTASYTTAPLTTTTYFRALVTSGVCTALASNVITITVTPASNAGTLSGNQTICYNNPVTISTANFTGSLQWQQSANGTSGWANILGATSASYTSANLTANNYYRLIVTNTTCASATSANILVTVTNSNYWLGAVSTEWNTPANWSCGVVPNTIIDANIPVVGTGRYPILTTGTGICKDLNISSGASVTINNTGVLEIAAAINNSGTINTVNGTVHFIGTSAQSIPANAFQSNTIKNLTINNTAGVTMLGANDLTGILDLKAGTFNTGNLLTLKSNVNTTAMIAPVTGSVNGNMIIERYIPSRRAFRFLSSPVDGGTIRSNWQEGGITPDIVGFGTDITGAGGTTNGFDVSGSNNPSLYTFTNNNTGTGSSWVAATSTNVPTVAGKAYRMLVRGDRTVNQALNASPSTVTTLRTTGTIKTGNVTVTDLNQTPDGLSLIGNPYQAPVDMGLLLANANLLNPNFYYLWDATRNTRGSYVTVNLNNDSNNVTGSVADRYLQPGQACFVKTLTAGAPSLMFKEEYKHLGTATTPIFKSAEAAAPMKLRFTLYESAALAANESAADGFVISFSENYSNGLDAMDAIKPVNQDENAGLMQSGFILSYESRFTPVGNDVIPVSITQFRNTNYTFKVSANGLPRAAYLLDKFTNLRTELDSEGVTLVPFSIDNAVPESLVANRFDIVFGESRLTTAENVFASATTVYPNPVTANQFFIQLPSQTDNITVKLTNMVGQEIYAVTPKVIQNKVIIQPEKTLQSGVYLVHISDGKSTATKKIIVK